MKARASENPSKPSLVSAENINVSEESKLEGWETDSDDGDYAPNSRKKAKTGEKMVDAGVSKGSPGAGGEGSSKHPKGKSQKANLKVFDSSEDQDSMDQTQNVEVSSSSHGSE